MPPFRKNQLLSEYSTFGIGGKARLFIEVSTFDTLCEVLAYCRRESLPFHVLGKGSNSLFDDRGFDGLVIHVKIAHLDIQDTRVTVGSGYSFALLGVKTARRGLTGLEFASGIPASVGGAIFMNAGAGEVETADVLHSLLFVDERGELHRLLRTQLNFAYRHSAFFEMQGVIAEATFALAKDPQARKRQLAIVEYRSKTQPYGELSCGCVFRNPKGDCAGRLIESCGLKGKSIGGAAVSQIHANFIINRGGALARDITSLAEHVKACVKRETGVELEMELHSVPFRV